MTVGLVEDQQAREAQLDAYGASDMLQHVQVHLAGKCGASPVFVEQEVQWPHPFLMRVGPTQHDGNIQNPTFTKGFELITADEHVILDAQVRKWNADSSDLVISATVRFSAWAPSATKLFEYAAIAHLTFSGFAAPAEGEEEDDYDT